MWFLPEYFKRIRFLAIFRTRFRTNKGTIEKYRFFPVDWRTGCFFISGQKLTIFFESLFDPIPDVIPPMDSPCMTIFGITISFRTNIPIICIQEFQIFTTFQVHHTWWAITGIIIIKLTFEKSAKNRDFFVVGTWLIESGSNFANRRSWWVESIGEVWAHFANSNTLYEKITIFGRFFKCQFHYNHSRR